MACRAIGNVQRGAGVVETIRIYDTIVDGSGSLIEMSMPIYIQIHAIRIEDALKSSLAIRADRG